MALVTPALFLEYEAVLKRPEHRRPAALTLRDVDAFLKVLAALMEPVELHVRWRPLLNDPGDELVLDAALNGRADAVVTYKALHFRLAARPFGLRVVTPSEIMIGLDR